MKFNEFRKAVAARPAFPAEQAELLGLVGITADRTALPVIVTPNQPLDVAAWLAAAAPTVNDMIDRHGALLFRGFRLNGAADMERCVRALIGEPMDYRENTSPRTPVRGKIHTSTDYPAAESILLHNEHSYSRIFPMRLFFQCVTPAPGGGCTPIADCGRLLRRIDPAIVRRFAERGWLYVRNFVPGIGQTWQTVYRHTERDALEAHFREADIGWEWTRGNLRTRILRPTQARHPRTAELSWLNHVLFWNSSSLDPDLRTLMLAEFGAAGLPHDTYYGDGSAIEAGVLDELRGAYREECRRFDWQAGDLLVLDNMKVAHGRDPYSGPREILFAMGQPFDRRGSDGWIEGA